MTINIDALIAKLRNYTNGLVPITKEAANAIERQQAVVKAAQDVYDDPSGTRLLALGHTLAALDAPNKGEE